jgi:hypothetical protein
MKEDLSCFPQRRHTGSSTLRSSFSHSGQISAPAGFTGLSQTGQRRG